MYSTLRKEKSADRHKAIRDKIWREFLQNVPAKLGFKKMCLTDNLPDTADCGGLRGGVMVYRSLYICLMLW